MDGRRQGRRSSNRRRVKELAAIAAALLVVPLAAFAGLMLPIDPSGPLAPSFTPAHSSFGQARKATPGAVGLSRAPVPTPDPPPRRAPRRELTGKAAAPTPARDRGNRHERGRAAA
jgi:hypothetical protein